MSERVHEQEAAGQDDLTGAYRALEQEADELLGHPDAESALDARASALVKHFRKLAKGHRQALERTRDETRTRVLAELRAQREQEAAYRRVGAGEAVRPLFAGTDLADQRAVAARVEELRAAGITWAGMPGAPPAPRPVGEADPTFQAMLAMQRAEAGGATPDQSLEHRLQKMAANPGDYSDAQRDAIREELNAAVRAAERATSSGALG